MLLTLLATLVLLGLVILVHELGHLLAAKALGVMVPRFSIGFGKRIWGFRIGETDYSVSAIPLGGYVALAGMEEAPLETPAKDMEVPRHRRFHAQPAWARAIILLAGVSMNWILAFVIFALSALIWGGRSDGVPRLSEALPGIETEDIGAQVVGMGGRPIRGWVDLSTAVLVRSGSALQLELENGRTIALPLPETDSARDVLLDEAFYTSVPARIGIVEDDSPAAKAGLREDDLIVSMAGQPIHDWHSFLMAIQESGGGMTLLEFKREGEILQTEIQPELTENGYQVGVSRAPLLEAVGLVGALRYGAAETWRWTHTTVRLLGDIVRGKVRSRAIGGPIQVGRATGQVVRIGIEAYLIMVAVVSVSLAIMNLLPIPVLDGGHLAILLAESVSGRRFPPKTKNRMIRFGLVMVLALMIWTTGNDLLGLLR